WAAAGLEILRPEYDALNPGGTRRMLDPPRGLGPTGRTLSLPRRPGPARPQTEGNMSRPTDQNPPGRQTNLPLHPEIPSGEPSSDLATIAKAILRDDRARGRSEGALRTKRLVLDALVREAGGGGIQEAIPGFLAWNVRTYHEETTRRLHIAT